MKPYKAVIFDLDGTILDTLEDLADSCNYALCEYGMPQRSIDEVRRFVGNGIRKLIERAVPAGTDDEMIEQVLSTFAGHYKQHCADKTKPYEGIRQLLRELRETGIRTAVVSNKADFAVQSLCRDYFPGLLDTCVGEREGVSRKPAPDSVYEVLRSLELNTDDAVYVGDSEVDVATAKNAGMDHIVVTWGFRDEQTLRSCGAEEIVKDVLQLKEFLIAEV